ncbi:M60 family metallopeptidase [Carboxylicivirga sp. RSCT41]|uniref:M60 family metallopeptidase n=1 Tax=Carboxylicivirga agarovorans TaxID=3417570 RepID=UPI003D352B7D
MRKKYFIMLIIAGAFGFACSDTTKEEPTVPRYEYQVGNHNDLSIGEPEKVVLNGLIFDMNHIERPSQPLSNAFDGDLSTKYHSPWASDNPPTEMPVILTVTLPDEAPSFEYLYYWPRQVGSNGRILKGEIKLSTQNNPDELISIYTMDFQDDANPKKIVIPGEYQGKIKKLVIHVTAGVADMVVIQEIEFYNEGLGVEIPSVFSNKSCSDLKPGVTREEIEDIENTVFRNIGLALFDQSYDQRRIGNYATYPHPSIQSQLNKTSTYSLLDNITGMYVEAGDYLLVFVDEHQKELYLRIIDHDQTGSAAFNGQNVLLSPGANKIKTSTKGLIYLLYHHEENEEVRVNFASGKINGYFDMATNTNEDWPHMLNSAVSNRLDLKGEFSHLIYDTDLLKEHTPDPARLLEVYDSIVWLEERFMGLYKYDRTNQSRMLFRSSESAAYMHATAYRTEYNPSTVANLCDVNALRTTSIWGPAHEVGHVNQTRPGFRWKNLNNESVLGEVSNNVYSLHVQTTFGNESRLETKNSYEPAFNTFMVQGMKHMDATGTVDKKYFWEQLVHFWQLELYFAGVLGNTDFYKDLHELIRNSPDPERGKEHHEFAFLASQTSGYDLTDFFNLWGYELSTEMETRIAALNLPKPQQAVHYIRDSIVETYKNSSAIVEGNASKSQSGSTVTVTLANFQNAVAYEVMVDGVKRKISIEDRFSFSVTEGEAYSVFAVAANNERLEITF